MEPKITPLDAIPKQNRSSRERFQYSPSLTGSPEGGAMPRNTGEVYRPKSDSERPAFSNLSRCRSAGDTASGRSNVIAVL